MTTTHSYSTEERRERLDAAQQALTTAVEVITTSDQWESFLAFAGKLHQYSAGNRFWLFQQAMERGWDDLGHVAGFRTWLTLGRYVRKGEHGLKVLAPCRYKVRDEATGEDTWRLRGFTVETVFAARQTDGEGDIPEPVCTQLLAGAGPAGAWDALAHLIDKEGFTVRRADLFPANGETQFASRTVTVAARLDGAAAVKTLAHELAHVLLHRPGQVDYVSERGRVEAEAESVAFLVCSELGLATGAYTFPYVAHWSKGDMRVVTAAVEAAVRCAADILAALERLQEPEAA